MISRSAQIFLLSFLLLIPWLGNRDFYSRGEPREALVMQDILEHGRWVLPEGYGGAVPSKPPMMHWLGAVLSLPGGEVTEYTARLPSALSALSFSILFFAFLRRRRSEAAAFASCAVLVTTVEWFRAAISARVDMMLAAVSCAALLMSFEWLENGGFKRLLAAIALYSAAALTKGPVGLLLPIAVLSVYQVLRGRSVKRTAAACFALIGPALILPLLWYVLASYERPGAFFDKVYYENVQRFLGTQEDEPHKASALVLYISVAAGLLPWTLFCLPQMLSWLGGMPGACRRFLLRMRSGTKAAIKETAGDLKKWDPLDLFMLIAALCVTVFYSIPDGKRGVYLLPVYPFFAYWIAQVLERSGMKLKWASFYVGFIGIAGALITIYAPFIIPAVITSPPSFVSATVVFYIQKLGEFNRSLRPADLFVLACPGAVFVWVLLKRRRFLTGREITTPLFVLTFFIELALNGVVMRAFANSVSSKHFARKLESVVPRNEDLYSFAYEYYGVSFHMKRRISRLEETNPTTGFVLVDSGDTERLKKALPGALTVEPILVSEKGIVRPQSRAVLMQILQTGKF